MGLFALLACVLMSASALASPSDAPEVHREADPETMDSFDSFLDIRQSSRVAGRVWADKTVFAKGEADGSFDGDVLSLDGASDGVDGEIALDGDFLHVYSVLGSSQVFDEATPVDLMLCLDVSGSMGRGEGNSYYTGADFDDPDSKAPAQRMVKAVNEAIRTIVTASPDSRVGISVYGSTAAVLLPLGHYVVDADTDVLDCSYLGSYGTDSPTGVHFRVEAHVTERGTGRKLAFAVDNAGKTNNEAHGITGGSGNRLLPGTGGHTTGAGTVADPWHVGHITNQQAGLACAMEQLASDANIETTWTGLDGVVRQRMPALIHLTDGQASDLVWIQDPADPDSPDAWGRVRNNWYDVDWTWDKAYNSLCSTSLTSADRYNAHQMSSVAGDVSVITFQTILTASYYKQWVNLHYGEGLDAGDARPLACYSIYASDTTPYESLSDINRAIVDLNMNPGASLFDRGKVEADTYDGYVDATYKLLSRFSAGEVVADTFSTVSGTKTTLNASKAQIADDAHGVSADDLEFAYVDKGDFYHVGFDELSDIFATVAADLMQEVFSPIGGRTDLATEDAITYVDPIGNLMDVSSVDALVLFGKSYGVVPAAVYDRDFMEARAGFAMGWYLGDEGASAVWGGAGKALSDGSTVPEESFAGRAYGTSAEAWADGWRYRVDDATAASFVPNFAAGDRHLSTDYTFYRLAVPSAERDALHMNPAYGTDLPYIPAGADYTRIKGVYKLSDIRIWTEDTRDWEASDSLVESDADFTEALWVNVPAGALPLRVARIGGSASSGYTYETNVDAGGGEALPLRVIYSVSLADEVSDGAGGIDFPKVDGDYREIHQVLSEEAAADRGLPLGAIEFRSNHWDESNVYSGYATHDATGDYSFGDPVVSFSPSSENRYYIFQRPLCLYDAGMAYVEDEAGPSEVAIPDDGAMAAFESAYPKATESIETDSWYYMVVDYYEVTGGVCKPMRRAVTRRGAEFGSGIGEGSYGAYVTWLDEATGKVSPYTADAGHGRPDGADWVLAAARGGIRTGDLAQSVVSKGGPETASYVARNRTHTANNRLLSAVGRNSVVGSVQIDAYLGNDGRLWAVEPVLFAPEVLKRVVDVAGAEIFDWDFTGRPFEFDIAPEGASPVPEVSRARCDVSGLARWGEVELERGRTYEWVVTEVEGASPDVSYDGVAHRLSVSVAADGSLSVSWDGEPSSASPSVTNVYSPGCELALGLDKRFVDDVLGRDLAVGEGRFSFALVPAPSSPDAPLPQESVAGTAEGGRVLWDPIAFESEGEWDYEVREVDPQDRNVVWDETVHRVHVSVVCGADHELHASWTWDGEGVSGDLPSVVNTYLPEVFMPATGGDGTWPWVLGLVFVLVGSGAFCLRRRRKAPSGSSR